MRLATELLVEFGTALGLFATGMTTIDRAGGTVGVIGTGVIVNWYWRPTRPDRRQNLGS